MPFFSWAPCIPSYGHYLHHIPFQTPHLPKASHLRAHVAFPHSLLTQVSPILHLPGQRQALYPLSFSHCSKEEGGGCIRISPLQHHFTEGDQLMVAQKNKKNKRDSQPNQTISLSFTIEVDSKGGNTKPSICKKNKFQYELQVFKERKAYERKTKRKKSNNKIRVQVLHIFMLCVALFATMHR